MSNFARALVVLAIVPLLMANQPPDCPPWTVEVEVDVLAVERTTYACALAPLADAPGCVETFSSSWSECNSGGIDVRFADGTKRSIPRNSNTVTRTCDLPSGKHAVSLCVPGGSLTCDLELGSTMPGASLAARATAPYRFLYHVRAERSVPELGGATFDLASDVELSPHTRHSIRLLFFVSPKSAARAPQPYSIEACNIDHKYASPAPQRGCGHCSVGEPGLLVVVAAALAAAMRRRS